MVHLWFARTACKDTRTRFQLASLIKSTFDDVQRLGIIKGFAVVVVDVVLVSRIVAMSSSMDTKHRSTNMRWEFEQINCLNWRNEYADELCEVNYHSFHESGNW